MEKRIRKILHANTGLVAGGAERLISDILPLIKARGYDVELLIVEDKGNNIFEDYLVKKDIKIIKLKTNNKFNLKNFMIIRKIIKKYDIVHTHIFPMQYWVPLATIGMKKKPVLITTEHNTFNRRRRYRWLRYIERFIYSRYDKIISISPEAEESLIEWLKINKNDKYKVIKNGIDLNKFMNAKAINLEKILNTPISKDDKFILMVARFDEQKDHLTVLKAMKELSSNFKLILIGEGELEGNIRKIAKDYKIHKRVFFLGKRNDVPQITKSVDICVLSSKWEGFGLVAIEGMAAGKPVIASKVPGLEKVIGNAGLLFEVGDYVKLASIIKRLLSDRLLYSSFCTKSISHSKEFNINDTIDEYIKIYENEL